MSAMQSFTHPFLSFFGEQAAQRIQSEAVREPRPAGEMIFDEGEASDAMYLVLRGVIRVSKKDAAGRQVVIAMVKADDFFGEFGMLDGGPRSARAVVEQAAVLVRLPRETILKGLEDGDSHATGQLITHLIHKIRATNEWYVQEMLRTERMTMVGRMANEIIHDFRNPFSVIQMAASILGTRPDPREAAEMAQLIDAQIRRMNMMAGEILQFSKGETTLHTGPVDVAALLDRFEQLFSRFLAQQSVDLRIVRLQQRLMADEDKLLRVLQNLVHNAAEAFRGKPGVIEVIASSEAGGVALRVRDNGPGLPEVIRKNLFEAFSTHGKSHGTGLGMAISRSFVEAHGGSIEVESTSSTGTTFLIRLPLRPPA